MNVFGRIQVLLGGSPDPVPLAAAVPPPSRASRRLVCPECGGGDASEEISRDKTSTRLTRPDCGFAQTTELLGAEDLRLAYAKRR